MADIETDRRRQRRTEVRLSAVVERVSGRTLRGDASTVDLSEGGARIVGPASLAVGDVVRLTITGGDVRVEQQGLVVGHQPAADGDATLNIAFKSLDEREVVDLRRLIDPV